MLCNQQKRPMGNLSFKDIRRYLCHLNRKSTIHKSGKNFENMPMHPEKFLKSIPINLKMPKNSQRNAVSQKKTYAQSWKTYKKLLKNHTHESGLYHEKGTQTNSIAPYHGELNPP